MEDSRCKEASLKNTLIKCENIIHELDELMYQFLDNVKYVTKRLKTTLLHNKRDMVNLFCENLMWKDEKVRWDWEKPYFILANQPKNSTVLPLKDLFCNHKIEFGISLNDLKIAFESLGLNQPKPALATI